jgi:hypothetical protein
MDGTAAEVWRIASRYRRTCSLASASFNVVDEGVGGYLPPLTARRATMDLVIENMLE